MDVSVFLALGAALSWTLAALVSHRPATELGSLHFNRVRMIAATLIMGTILVISGRPFDIPPIFFSSIILSALAGVVLGDFSCLPRRAGSARGEAISCSPAMPFLPRCLDGSILAR